MIFIAHRGNLFGPQPENENKIPYLQNAIDKGFFVEVDIIDYDGNDVFTLGHDTKQEQVSSKFLRNKHIFAHAKNFKSLNGLLNHGVNCFYHTEEDYVLTSENKIWVYPGVKPSNHKNCIIVLPELYEMNEWKNAYGICSDFVANYRKEFEV